MVAGRIAFPVELRLNGFEVHVVSVGMPRRRIRTPFVEDALVEEWGEGNPRSRSDETLVRQLLRNDAADATSIPANDFIAEHRATVTGTKIVPVFHMSRCGSTLASRMLAECDRCFVLSEPPIVNSILDPMMPLSRAMRIALLQASFNAMILAAPTACVSVVMKFRSWNILFHDELMLALGQRPWVFVHRRGIEVLVSVLRNPPGWLRSKRTYAPFLGQQLGLPGAEVIAMPVEEFACRMLGAFCRVAAARNQSKPLAIDYVNIAPHLHDRLEGHCGVRFTDREKEAGLRFADVYSKDVAGLRPWQSDEVEKQADATEPQLRLAELFIETQRAMIAQEL
jgi:hypothetical protein